MTTADDITRPHTSSTKLALKAAAIENSVGAAGPDDKRLAFGEAFQLPAGAADDPEWLASAIATVSARLPAEVVRSVEDYSPTSLSDGNWNRIAALVRAGVLAVAPNNRHTATQFAAALVGFIHWVVNERGHPPRFNVVYSAQVIDLWQRTAAGTRLDEGTLRNYRSRIVRAAEALGVQPPGQAHAPLRRTSAREPYSDRHQERLYEWMGRQVNEVWRRRATAVVTLTIGAGLWSHELLNVRSSDILEADGLWVRVRGEQERIVPVDARWAPPLRRLREATQDGELLYPAGGEHPSLRGLRRVLGDGTPDPRRLRATWIVNRLREEIPPATLLAWSGIARGETLLGYLRYAPDRDINVVRRELWTAQSAVPEGGPARSEDPPRIETVKGRVTSRIAAAIPSPGTSR